MNQRQIQNRFKTIVKKQAFWDEQLSILRIQCKHTDVKQEYKSCVGNYDPSSDSYWIEYRCADCGKYWETDQ